VIPTVAASFHHSVMTSSHVGRSVYIAESRMQIVEIVQVYVSLMLMTNAFYSLASAANARWT
jgi:hypothetical protein